MKRTFFWNTENTELIQEGTEKPLWALVSNLCALCDFPCPK